MHNFGDTRITAAVNGNAQSHLRYQFLNRPLKTPYQSLNLATRALTAVNGNAQTHLRYQVLNRGCGIQNDASKKEEKKVTFATPAVSDP